MRRFISAFYLKVNPRNGFVSNFLTKERPQERKEPTMHRPLRLRDKQYLKGSDREESVKRKEEMSFSIKFM